MEPGELKPLLAALLLPPAGPLLLALMGLLMSLRARRFGAALCLLGLSALWLLSCNAVAIALAQGLLPRPQPLTLQRLLDDKVQAIVVLGGGVLPQAPEFGQAQPAPATWARLRYGVWLARSSGRPLAFTGGVGWAATGTAAPSEGEVARRVMAEDWGLRPAWLENSSRDTAENARKLHALMLRDAALLQGGAPVAQVGAPLQGSGKARPGAVIAPPPPQDGPLRVALVTDAFHMKRAVREFERAGFAVTPAPTGLALPRERPLLEWLPSSHGLGTSRQVLREWAALQVAGR